MTSDTERTAVHHSDDELVARIASGDRGAFDVLYRRYSRRLLGYLLRQVGRRTLAEEVLNDVMMAVWNGASSYEGRSRASTWIFGIARRQALSALGRRRCEVSGDERPETGAPDRRSAGLALRDALGRALRRLSDEHREVVELTFVHEFTYAEIAEIVGCPLGTVKTRMFHARRQLRRILPELGWEGSR